MLQAALRNWPFYRGRGVLLRTFGGRLQERGELCTVEPGIYIPAELDDYMVHWCFVGDHVRDRAFQLSLSLLTEGAIVLDIGANVGLWAMSAARRVGERGRVHAFEPLTGNYSRLARNLRMNGVSNVETQRIALGAESGRTTFYAPASWNSGAGSLAPHEGVDIPIEVEVRTVDEYRSERGLESIDFLKIDVEGGERSVFEGAARTLAAPDAPAIMVEVNDSLAAPFGSSTLAVRALLAAHGYEFFLAGRRGLETVSANAPLAVADLFAFKASHRERYAYLFR